MLSSQASEIWLTSQCANELRERNESGVSPKNGCLRRVKGEKYMETDTKAGSVTVVVKCLKGVEANSFNRPSQRRWTLGLSPLYLLL